MSTPDFRIVVRRDAQVRLVDWAPWLPSGGPLGPLLHARGRAGVAIADVTLVHPGDDADEAPEAALLDVLAGWTPRAAAAVGSWAGSVGLRRVWLPEGPVELDGLTYGTEVTTVCTGCRARWTDGRPEFWTAVRRSARFPTMCPLCGGDLPQWQPTGGGAVATARVGRPRRATTRVA